MLRITYRCPICGSIATRCYDTEFRGYTVGPGGSPDHSANAQSNVDSHAFKGHSCRHEANCAKIKRWLDHAHSCENPVELASTKIANLCPDLSDEELGYCFNRFFANVPEGRTFDLFRAGYHSQRNIERIRAAALRGR